tara:strand:+ start:41095 stop:41652 length:558 start_codon:yes stop_codon:yes gene_type:complete
MKSSRISSRYAKSLLTLVIDQNKLAETLKDITYIINVCSENKDFSRLLKSPIVKTDKKISILKEIFKDHISELTMDFVKIITIKKREIYLESISESFISQYKTYMGIETVSVTTASPLNDEMKLEIINYIKKTGKSQLELTEFIDKEIIGGIIIKIGDKQLDASVIRNLKKLKKTFNKNLYIKDY